MVGFNVKLNIQLNQEENSLLKTFFEHQHETRKSKNWETQVSKDMDKFEITLTFDEIRKMPEESWKSFVKRKSIENALEYLNFNQESQSQKNKSLMMAPFLSSDNNKLSLKTSRVSAKIQTHMIENIKCTFKEYYKPNLVCNSCHLNECYQKHLLECSKLIGISNIHA